MTTEEEVRAAPYADQEHKNLLMQFFEKGKKMYLERMIKYSLSINKGKQSMETEDAGVFDRFAVPVPCMYFITSGPDLLWQVSH